MSGHADCFTDSPENYPMGGLYVTARAVAMHTIDLNANCNDWQGTHTFTTGADDNAWLDMSLVPVPYGHYPQTFMYGFLCHGRDTVNGEDYSNSSAAQGWSYLSHVSPSSAQGTLPAIYRVDGCGDPEMIWKPTSTAVGTQGPQHGYEASRDAMEFNCNTLHRD